jgi:hypothetical protein
MRDILRSLWMTVFLIALVPFQCFASTENLDEMMSRQANRLSGSNTFSYQYMENAANHYLWQPETLRYADILTGNEVWKIAGSGLEANDLPDISFPQFSADGKYLVFESTRASASLPTPSWGASNNGRLQMVMRTDGSILRPTPNATNRCLDQRYFTWSPVELNIGYNFGVAGTGVCGEGETPNILYQDTFSDLTESHASYLTFPANSPSSGMVYRIKKGISGDGTVVMADSGTPGTVYLQPAQVYPTASKALLLGTAYNANRPTYDSYWGDHSSLTWTTLHDQYMSGTLATTVWFHWMPEQGGIGIWWRSTPTGTASDGGPVHTSNHTGPFTPQPWGGQMEPTNTITTGFNQLDPWQNPTGTPVATASYFSHYTPDRWGHYIICASSQLADGGTGIWDSTNDDWIVQTFGQLTTHNDWHAWSDWSVSSNYQVNSVETKISTQNFNDSNSQIVLCSTHTNGEGNYNELPRPTQSPDGTKVVWHSSFLGVGASTAWDLMYVVAHYPYPPEIYQATASGGKVTLTFDYGENRGTPRGYTTRRWPDESTGTYPPPRETKQFRLWSSANGTSGWTPVTTTAYTGWSRYNYSTGVWTGNTYQTITAGQAAGTTMYYALTAQEWSGLEGTIGNVWEVTLTSGGAISSSVQQTTYPSTPGAKPTHYTTAPGAPTGLAVTYEQSPATAPGQYTISWTAPSDPKGLIRHYNLYALDGSTPTAIQNRRVASIAVGATSFIDWLGNTNGSTEYALTSVDYFGNESQAATVGGNTDPPPPPTGVHLVE